ncbi:MAG: hypothetical protein ACE5FT_00320 [Candidatus Nanoarchaeia archaeon]
MDDLIALGGNIELSGFSKLDRGSMMVLKKIVGSYARKFADRCDVEALKLRMKSIHGSKVELHSQLVTPGRTYSSEVVDHNLFFVLDKGLKKLEHSMST